MSSRNRRQPLLRLEQLERRDLLSASAQLVNDFDFSNFNYRSSPISVVESEDITYQIVRQADEQGAAYFNIGRIDGNQPRGVEVGKVLDRATPVVEDQLYFVIDIDDSIQELWKTDSTEEGTARLVAMPGQRDTLDNLTAFNDKLYFSHRNELWATDGTESGTKLVKDLKSCEGFCDEWVSHGHTKLHGSLFFALKPRCYSTADVRCQETEIWKSDGTGDGTQFVVTIPSDARIIAATESHIFLENRLQENALWATDGTVEGTYRLLETDNVFQFTVADDRLFYVKGIRELWVTDGTTEGTHFVKETLLSGNIEGCGTSGLLAAGGIVYFSAEDESGNHGLWKSDGTEGGTVLVKEMRFAPMVAAGNIVYLAGYDEATGVELWKSDGTPEGTVQVVDLISGPESSLTRLSQAVPNNGMLYFTADDGKHGFDLWRIPLDVPGDMPSFIPQAGDANADGQFDQLDLVTLLQAGKYNTSEAATFEEGDFNGDSLFNQLDIVAALQTADYLRGPYTADTEN